MRGRIPGSAGWRTNSLEAARAIRVPANFRSPVEEGGGYEQNPVEKLTVRFD